MGLEVEYGGLGIGLSDGGNIGELLFVYNVVGVHGFGGQIKEAYRCGTL